MSIQQDRFTFFSVLIAVVIVVLGYLKLGQLYPVAGRDTPAAAAADERVDDKPDHATQEQDIRRPDAAVHPEGSASP